MRTFGEYVSAPAIALHLLGERVDSSSIGVRYQMGRGQEQKCEQRFAKIAFEHWSSVLNTSIPPLESAKGGTYANLYGNVTVLPVNWLAQVAVGTPDRLAVPVMYEVASQNRSGLLPPTTVREVNDCMSMVERLAATKPP